MNAPKIEAPRPSVLIEQLLRYMPVKALERKDFADAVAYARRAVLTTDEINAANALAQQPIKDGVPDFKAVGFIGLHRWTGRAGRFTLAQLLKGDHPEDLTALQRASLAVAMGAVGGYRNRIETVPTSTAHRCTFAVEGDRVQMVEHLYPSMPGGSKHCAELDLWELRCALARLGIEL